MLTRLHSLRKTLTRGVRLWERALIPTPLSVFQMLRLNLRSDARERDARVLIGSKWRFALASDSRIELGPCARLLLGGGNQRVLDSGRGSIRMGPRSTLRVLGSARLGSGSAVRLSPGACLTIGDGVLLGARTTILVAGSVEIQGGTVGAWDVTIMDHDAHQIEYAEAESGPTPIVIGQRCWLGFGATVLKGVTIEDGSVVAARAVVTRRVPAKSVVAGSPARVVRSSVEWS
jgi:tetrahydrodipicolinate N-acetyltransferase